MLDPLGADLGDMEQACEAVLQSHESAVGLYGCLLYTSETPASYWYYFDKNGKSVISKWIKLNENWYYFNESGHMATGKTVIDGAVYYLGGETDGRMKTGWVKLEENASSPGASESGHYFNSDGRMVENHYDKKIGDD